MEMFSQSKKSPNTQQKKETFRECEWKYGHKINNNWAHKKSVYNFHFTDGEHPSSQ